MLHKKILLKSHYPKGKYLFTVNNKDTRIESIVFLSLTLNMYLPTAFLSGYCDFMEHVNLYAPYISITKNLES